jgi:hypothetical protein
MLLDPGFELTLRPMRYPQFYDMYRDAIKNTWTVDEINFQIDITDLHAKMTPADRHLIHRLVAFFATGDSIVSNNLVLNLYQHINAPEARMYLSRQLYEEALHVQFYLTLLDNYLPDPGERAKAFAAVENIPSIRKKAEFCFKWMDTIQDLKRLETRAHRRQFLLRGPVLLRRLRLRVLLPLARSAAGPGLGHQLGVPRRELPHGLRLRGRARGARGGAGPVRRGDAAAGLRHAGGGDRV